MSFSKNHYSFTGLKDVYGNLTVSLAIE